jgi:hypothetical protein
MCRFCRTNSLRRRAMAEIKGIDDGEQLDPRMVRELLQDLVADAHGYMTTLRAIQMVAQSDGVELMPGDGGGHVH